jgi:hypothetical protein
MNWARVFGRHARVHVLEQYIVSLSPTSYHLLDDSIRERTWYAESSEEGSREVSSRRNDSSIDLEVTTLTVGSTGYLRKDEAVYSHLM